MTTWVRLKCDKCDEYIDGYYANSYELFDVVCLECRIKEEDNK